MPALLNFPFSFFNFWFAQAPYGLVLFFLSFNNAVVNMLSIPTMFKTFFKPLKNEYRKGLVGFSIGMGIVVKSVLIMFSLFLLGLIMLIEFFILVVFISLPVLILALLVA